MPRNSEERRVLRRGHSVIVGGEGHELKDSNSRCETNQPLVTVSWWHAIRRVTISDVAERAGVSGRHRLERREPAGARREGTRRRVREAITTLRWVPNSSAATLRAGRATLVGLILPDIRNPFFTEVARGAEDMAAANGEAIVVCNTDWLLADEQRALEALARQRVRGVIINPAGEDERYLEWLSARGIALVLLDHRRSAGHVPSVVVDDVLGGRLAGERLVRLGHRRMAFLNGPMSIPQCEDRRDGFLRALVDGGVDTARDLVEVEVESMDATSGLEAVDRLFAGVSPTAVFCANDLLAIGVLRGCAGADCAPRTTSPSSGTASSSPR